MASDRILFGITHWHEFTRDDGTTASINYKLAPEFPEFPGSFDDPPEGGEVIDWVVYTDGGQVTLTDAEAERAEREVYAKGEAGDGE